MSLTQEQALDEVAFYRRNTQLIHDLIGKTPWPGKHRALYNEKILALLGELLGQPSGNLTAEQVAPIDKCLENLNTALAISQIACHFVQQKQEDADILKLQFHISFQGLTRLTFDAINYIKELAKVKELNALIIHIDGKSKDKDNPREINNLRVVADNLQTLVKLDQLSMQNGVFTHLPVLPHHLHTLRVERNVLIKTFPQIPFKLGVMGIDYLRCLPRSMNVIPGVLHIFCDGSTSPVTFKAAAEYNLFMQARSSSPPLSPRYAANVS